MSTLAVIFLLAFAVLGFLLGYRVARHQTEGRRIAIGLVVGAVVFLTPGLVAFLASR